MEKTVQENYSIAPVAIKVLHHIVAPDHEKLCVENGSVHVDSVVEVELAQKYTVENVIEWWVMSRKYDNLLKMSLLGVETLVPLLLLPPHDHHFPACIPALAKPPLTTLPHHCTVHGRKGFASVPLSSRDCDDCPAPHYHCLHLNVSD